MTNSSNKKGGRNNRSSGFDARTARGRWGAEQLAAQARKVQEHRDRRAGFPSQARSTTSHAAASQIPADTRQFPSQARSTTSHAAASQIPADSKFLFFPKGASSKQFYQGRPGIWVPASMKYFHYRPNLSAKRSRRCFADAFFEYELFHGPVLSRPPLEYRRRLARVSSRGRRRFLVRRRLRRRSSFRGFLVRWFLKKSVQSALHNYRFLGKKLGLKVLQSAQSHSLHPRRSDLFRYIPPADAPWRVWHRTTPPMPFWAGFNWRKSMGEKYIRYEVRRLFFAKLRLHRIFTKLYSNLHRFRRSRLFIVALESRLLRRCYARRRAYFMAKAPHRKYRTPFIRIRKTLHNLFFSLFNSFGKLIHTTSLYALVPKTQLDKYSKESIAIVVRKLAVFYRDWPHHTLAFQLYSPLNPKIFSIIRGLRSHGLQTARIDDRVRTPHNGLRAKKHRNQRR